MAFNFIGGSYTSTSAKLDAQRTINLYVETDPTGQGKSPAALIGTPGLEAFCTLPTEPIRGMLTGSSNRMFVVAGNTYYEVHQDGSYTTRGTVATDSLNTPVQMFANGTQVLIIASGNAYIDDGVSVTQAQYQNGSGTVTTSGSTVTWISGSQFDSSNVGNPMVIDGTIYNVASVTDEKHCTLTSAAGTHTGTVFSGTCDTDGDAVTWVSGDYFNPDPNVWSLPVTITINGVDLTISKVDSGTSLQLTVAAGTQTGVDWSVTLGVDYSASYPVTASSGAFLDGYYVVSKPGSKQVNISALRDGTTWNAIDFAIKEGNPDGIVALLADHEELWIFGGESIEIWQDTGAATFPLQRNPNGFILLGLVAAASPVRIAGMVGFLSTDSRGGVVAYLANGFQPARVSTAAVESAWNAINCEDAVSYPYTDNGHQFWVISFPSASQTWVYDATEKLWHERSWWNASTSAAEMARSMFHGYVWGAHYTGDYGTGAIYRASTDIYDDFGGPIYRTRSAPHIANATLHTFFSELTLDVEIADDQGDFYLDWSDDATKTWITPKTATAYSDGRVVWRRLGKSKDRIFRVTYKGNGKVAWINAHVEAISGRT
jgi:hypothetical protein